MQQLDPTILTEYTNWFQTSAIITICGATISLLLCLKIIHIVHRDGETFENNFVAFMALVGVLASIILITVAANDLANTKVKAIHQLLQDTRPLHCNRGLP